MTYNGVDIYFGRNVEVPMEMVEDGISAVGMFLAVDVNDPEYSEGIDARPLDDRERANILGRLKVFITDLQAIVDGEADR